ncbi:MAG: hypothetical protein AAF907_03145 [Planctomycetota bacterium]
MTPLLLVAFSFAPADGGDTHLLRYKFTPGESLRNRITTAVMMDSKVQGNAQLVRNAGMTVQRVDVLPTPAEAPQETAGVVQVRSERVKLSMQFDANKPIHYDSEAKDPPPEGFEAVHKVAKAPLGELTISDRGTVMAAKSLLPGKENVAAQSAAEAYDDLFPTLPEAPVAVGATWDEMLSIKVQEGENANLLKPWKLRRRSTLTKVEDGVATISVKVTPLPPPTDPFFQQQLAMKCPAGLVEFDIAKGRILTLRAEVDQQIIGLGGPGGFLHLKSLHYQELLESGPTSEMTPPRVAAGDKTPAN